MIIAISGPAASGKGTLSRMLSKELNLPHYDFGLMFRAIAVLNSRFNFQYVLRLAQNHCFKVKGEEIWLRWINLTETLKSEEVGLLAARMAKSDLFWAIRIAQAMVEHEDFICDGRTCGSEIYTAAGYKFYIVAEKFERFSRRLGDGGSADILAERDEIDNSRLKIPNGAVIINTTGKSKEESFQEVLSFLR